MFVKYLCTELFSTIYLIILTTVVKGLFHSYIISCASYQLVLCNVLLYTFESQCMYAMYFLIICVHACE